MRIPTSPPPFTSTPLESGEGLASSMTIASLWIREGRWVTWDEVRHRSREAGLSAESVWWCTRALRETHLQPVGVVDDQGRAFRLAPTLLTLQEHLREIDLALGGSVSSGFEIGAADRDRVLLRSLTEEALRSSEIEGAVTTRARARAMLTSGAPPQSRDERMVVNTFRAMTFVQRHRDTPITVDHLRQLHLLVVEGTLDDPDDAGRFRSHDDDVRVVAEGSGEVVHTPPPAEELSARLEALLAFANARESSSSELPWLHPALRAIVVHFLLGWLHPFVDGNGRCARLLWYWVMLRNGYWLAEFLSLSEAIKARKVAYYRAFLDTECHGNDLTYFAVMHVKAVSDAIQRLRDRLERHRMRMNAVQEDLGTLRLNHRQKNLLLHALRHPGERYSFETHARHHGVVYATGRADLMDLAKRGLLPETLEGRTRIFVAPRDLQERIVRLQRETG